MVFAVALGSLTILIHVTFHRKSTTLHSARPVVGAPEESVIGIRSELRSMSQLRRRRRALRSIPLHLARFEQKTTRSNVSLSLGRRFSVVASLLKL